MIGGGPAGMAAAASAARHGVQVALIDERTTFGGQIFKRLGPGFHLADPADLGNDYSRGAQLIEGIDHRLITLFNETLVLTIEGSTVITSHPRFGVRNFSFNNLIVAPGAYDRPVVFPGWTLPGVMTAGAVQTLVKTQQISPGRKILFAGSGPLALAFSAQLIKLGAPVYKVLESAPFPSPLSLARLALNVGGNLDLAADALRYQSILLKNRIPFLYRRIILKAEGDGRVESVTYGKVDRNWNLIPGSEVSESVDTLCIGYGFFPSHELLRLVDCSFSYDENKGGFTVDKDRWGQSSIEGIFAVGDGTGVTGSYSAVAQGSVAGLRIAHLQGKLSESDLERAARPFHRELAARNSFQKALNKVYSIKPGIYRLADKDTVICRCENIKKSEIDPIVESTDDLSVIKSYCRAGMGLCQGRNCQRQIAAMISEKHGKDLSEINFATPRFPVKPVEIGLIADPSIQEEKYFIT
ncbi:MAG: NAD(P)/FAD-dependent oxidoreductase [Actinobacteria bacterium]|nr:NAD(P)/FAD-dependent oxidoreductase [Actinomycetota bacterium]MDA2984792.1 NAD(P)/FAD-dependent oxidoreductase [Actinomycetota bacterium]